MTVQSSPRSDEKPAVRSSVSWSKVAAVIAWLIGAFTTWLFVAKATPNLSYFTSAVIAVVAQALLTFAERPLFRRVWGRSGKITLLSGLSLIVDTLLNAAGIYPYTSRLAQTDLGAMLTEVFHVTPGVDPVSAFLVAAVVGAVIAGMPEGLWES